MNTLDMKKTFDVIGCKQHESMPYSDVLLLIEYVWNAAWVARQKYDVLLGGLFYSSGQTVNENVLISKYTSKIRRDNGN